MSKREEMTWQEWKELGNTVKKLYRLHLDVFQLMSGRFNKTGRPMKSAWRVYNGIHRLKSDLDDVVCAIRWPDKSNSEVVHVFYGDDSHI
jgi:hypothetical protein